MEKFAIINTCDWGSTGKIASGLQNFLLKRNIDALFCYGRGNKLDDNRCYRFCKWYEVYLHYASEFFSGQLNKASDSATKRLIARLRKEHVKNIFLINLHGHILNESRLFSYFIEDEVRVVYIMADESAFLGNCTYRYDCEEFRNECGKCKAIKGVAKMVHSDASQKAFKEKMDAYNRMKKITFVAPEFVVKSAMASPLMEGKRLEIVDEAIDISINCPKETEDLRKYLGIKDEQIVIGCIAPVSDPRKGVRYFIEAAKSLENDDRFIFVQVGYNLKNKSGLPRNYIPKGYVNNQAILTQYYSLADLFVFPSIQDTMPNACLEALACGTPLLCFNISGMPYIADNSVMTLVEAGNVEQIVDVIKRTKKKKQKTINICRRYALKRYDNQMYFRRLISIMNSMK